MRHWLWAIAKAASSPALSADSKCRRAARNKDVRVATDSNELGLVQNVPKRCSNEVRKADEFGL